MDIDASPAIDADYLSSAALQRLTGIPASTWRYWAINDDGPPSFKLGRRRLWRRSAVLDWIADQEAASRAEAGDADHESPHRLHPAGSRRHQNPQPEHRPKASRAGVQTQSGGERLPA